jgi:uncharacterized protein YkwD
MFQSLTILLAFFSMGGGAGPAKPAAQPAKAAVVSASLHQLPLIRNSLPYDLEAEQQLLDLANEARVQAGLEKLQPDAGLTQAAREHAAEMAEQQQLSHQFASEPSLALRLAAETTLHLDRAGENVAYSGSVDQAQNGLMHSPPHRENLLNPGYNVAGFGVVHSGSLIYVAQDFGHSLPTYSGSDAERMVSANVARVRGDLPPLARTDGTPAEAVSYAMARADSLSTPAVQGRYVLRYTSMQPGSLPASAEKAITDRSIHSFAVGACYSHSTTYPNGAYWITIVFY